MIRFCLSFFLFLYSMSIWADKSKGMVVALHAPLFATPDWKAPVIQYLNKGDTLYLHPDALKKPIIIKSPHEVKGFYLTIDRNGHDAYIPKKFVNLLIDGVIEVRQPRDFEEIDPTDRRLAEPIPSDYPFDYSLFITSQDEKKFP